MNALHETARAHCEAAVASGTRFVTTNYVVDETATRLRYGAGLDAALAFRRALVASIARKRVRLVWVDERLERQACDVLEQYRDVELSLTDATSAVAARRDHGSLRVRRRLQGAWVRRPIRDVTPDRPGGSSVNRRFS